MENINIVPAKENNSLRDNVKDTVNQYLTEWLGNQNDGEASADIADAVFDALEITPEQQDIVGGIITIQTPPTDEKLKLMQAKDLLHRLYIMQFSGSITLKPEENSHIADMILARK